MEAIVPHTFTYISWKENLPINAKSGNIGRKIAEKNLPINAKTWNIGRKKA